MKLDNHKGFMTASLALMILVIPVATLIGLRYYSTIQKGTQIQKKTVSYSHLNTIKNWLIGQSRDADNDNYRELLKEGASNALPLSLPISGTDGWGRALKYYTWDLGAANANATYSQNVAAPPVAGLIGRVVSPGMDGVFQTTNAHTAAQGDDLVFDINDSDVKWGLSGLPSGWTTDGTNITQSNPAGKVTITKGEITTAPTTDNDLPNKLYADDKSSIVTADIKVNCIRSTDRKEYSDKFKDLFGSNIAISNDRSSVLLCMDEITPYTACTSTGAIGVQIIDGNINYYLCE
jgi:hypothetical protein